MKGPIHSFKMPLVRNELGREVLAALEPIAKRYGLQVRTAGGSYDDLRLLMKVEWTATSTGGQTAERVEFERYANLFGFNPADFGRTFKSNGIEYKVAGLAINRRRFPIVGINAKGKRMLFTVAGVLRQLHPERAATAND